MVVTTIDLGSNSLRILIYDCQNDKTIGEFEKTVGTADGLKKTAHISIDAQNRIIEALNQGKNKLKFDPKKAVAVTTQAMRMAKNNHIVLAKIKEETGVDFSIIDGNKEANLTLLAIKQALKREKIPNDKFIALDIGGGSSELILFDNGDVYLKSFSFGIVTLSQSDDRSKDLNSLKNQLQSYLDTLNQDLKSYRLVATAGTPTTIAAMIHNLSFATYDKNIVNGTQVCMEDIIDVQNYLNSLDGKTLEIKVGTGRTHYIDTGIEIFKLFYRVLQKNSSIVFDDGLREGVAIDYCLEHLHRL